MNFIDIILDTIHDTWAMLPLLYITYCILEVFERKNTQDDRLFFGLQRLGPILGALVGLIPQCGFSILAAMLFVQNNITLGTLVSVMIATSDEAIPILISNPKMYSSLLGILGLKLVIAIVVGLFTDHVLFRNQKILRFEDMEEEDYDDEDIFFEITERTDIENYVLLQSIMNHYIDQGYQIALDDVGAGYSGLNRVVNTTPNYLKADIELVRNIHLSKSKQSMMKLLVDYCDEMGLKLVAEGIETQEELECICNLHVHYGQGYYLGLLERKFNGVSSQALQYLMNIHGMIRSK